MYVCGEEMRYINCSRCPISSAGTALRETGGSSFEAAVKEVSDKQSLSIGEGTVHRPLLHWTQCQVFRRYERTCSVSVVTFLWHLSHSGY